MAENRLAGKTAVVTGAGSGMGRSIGELFAREGCAVVLADYNEKTVQETAEIIKKNGHKAMAIRTDVSDLKQVEKMIDAAVDNFGGLDILVNNAGVFDESKLVTESDEASWDKVLAVNLKGPFWACKHAIPHMLKKGRGAIVNVSSIAGLIGGAGGAAYTASKHGLIGLTKQMAVSYGPQGIKVNVICPGAIVTGMLPREQAEDLDNPYRAKFLSVPAARVGEASEIAFAALFLAGDESNFIHGQSLVVDGGWVIQA
jgi:3-oxoacyl-[acyl-carrier protein] reductase